jgi:hypothetical protein
MLDIIFLLIRIIGASVHDPSILIVVALLLAVGLRREIGDWIGRKFFGFRRP